MHKEPFWSPPSCVVASRLSNGEVNEQSWTLMIFFLFVIHQDDCVKSILCGIEIKTCAKGLMSKSRHLVERGLVWGHVKATLITLAFACLVSIESACDIKDPKRWEEGFDSHRAAKSLTFLLPLSLCFVFGVGHQDKATQLRLSYDKVWWASYKQCV